MFRPRNINRHRLLISAASISVAIAGYFALNISNAASFVVTAESESGQISGKAAKVNNAAVSGGSYVLFGDPTSMPPPSGTIYGSGYQMDALANMQVGGPASGANNTSVSYFFVAQSSSALNSIMIYALGADRPGYGGGNGGTLRVA